MSAESLVRWGGLAAIIAGVLVLVSTLTRLYVDVLEPAGLVWYILYADPWLGVLLAVAVQLGLTGVYAPRARALGLLGLIGFVLATAGIQLSVGASFVYASVKPAIWPWEDPEYFERTIAEALIFGLSFILGWLLIGVAAFRARVYPRSATALLIVGSLLLLLPVLLSDVIFAVAVTWLGYVLFMGRSVEAMQYARAS